MENTTRGYLLTDFLPTTKKEVELRGWNQLDVILFSGDAYVDHPAFGAAVIGRVLESKGMVISATSKSWDDHGCALPSLPVPWTPW